MITGIPELDKLDEARFWLQDVVRRMILVQNMSNFQTEIHEVYLDLGVLGTADISIMDDADSIIRFDARMGEDSGSVRFESALPQEM